jgi:GNAT superfamily N-acetyltransferase
MYRIPWAFGLRGFRRLLAYEAVGQELHHRHALRPHWYLWAIGVVPSRQGEGLAAKLMAPILARADQANVDCYLETQYSKNVRIYERQGFAVAEMRELPGRPYPVWGMLRRPKASRGACGRTEYA